MLQSRGTGGHASPAGASGDVQPRVEADLVRFDVQKLPSGLFRHRQTKFVYEIGEQQRKGRLPVG